VQYDHVKYDIMKLNAGDLLFTCYSEIDAAPYMLICLTEKRFYLSLKEGAPCLFLEVSCLNPLQFLIECDGRIGRIYSQYVK
jgi:hypothetical protein